MATILSYAGQKNKTVSNVVKQPAFFRSDQKPLIWWADKGLVYCADPNKPDKLPTYSQPLDALRRVAFGIKLFIADLDKNPFDYCVKRSVMADFFNNFKQKVFDVALKQDAQNGGVIVKTQQEYQRAKSEWKKESMIEAINAIEKKPKIYVSPKKPEASKEKVSN